MHPEILDPKLGRPEKTRQETRDKAGVNMAAAAPINIEETTTAVAPGGSIVEVQVPPACLCKIGYVCDCRDNEKDEGYPSNTSCWLASKGQRPVGFHVHLVKGRVSHPTFEVKRKDCAFGAGHNPDATPSINTMYAGCRGMGGKCPLAQCRGELGKKPSARCAKCCNAYRAGRDLQPLPLYATIPKFREEFASSEEAKEAMKKYASGYTNCIKAESTFPDVLFGVVMDYVM